MSFFSPYSGFGSVSAFMLLHVAVFPVDLGHLCSVGWSLNIGLIYLCKKYLILNCILFMLQWQKNSFLAWVIHKLKLSNTLPSWALQLSDKKLLAWLGLLQTLSYHETQMVTSLSLLTTAQQPDTTLTA